MMGAMLYCAVQWKYAARLGSQTIFSSTRTHDRASFADMLNNLTEATGKVCNANPLSRMLFDDGDYALPYMHISNDRIGGCVMIRNTNVTPFSKLDLDDCNVIFKLTHFQIINFLRYIPLN